MTGSKITIIGAGLSGMVAGINLRRAGYEVEIWDGAKKLGQLEDFHPSIHATPIDPRAVSSYVGVDVSPCFVKVKRFRTIIEDEKYDLNGEKFFLVERGGRKSSIDSYLHRIAVDLGIRFRFNHYIRSFRDVPERAIVATGFNREGMQALGIPFGEGSGVYARKKLDNPAFDQALMAWAGSYSTDYGYLSVANGLMFFMVFTRYLMTDQEAEACRRHLEETEGLTFPVWHAHVGHFPILGRNSLRLFHGDRVLTGTISGMIDPAGMFGIHGALMAGKVASLVFTDRKLALAEFERLNRNYQRVRVLSGLMRRIPMRLPLMHFMFRLPVLMGGLTGLLDDGIPGYAGHWGREMLRGRKRVIEGMGSSR